MFATQCRAQKDRPRHYSFCPLCSKDHNVRPCFDFLSFMVKERFRTASAKGLCFLFLKNGHRSDSCGRKTLCMRCKSRPHHLHTDKPPLEKPPLEKTGTLESRSAGQKNVSKAVPSNVTDSSVGTSEFRRVILQTVPAVLCGSNENSMVVRCFVYSVSHISFIERYKCC